jgi:hypothetical protein
VRSSAVVSVLLMFLMSANTVLLREPVLGSQSFVLPSSNALASCLFFDESFLVHSVERILDKPGMGRT